MKPYPIDLVSVVIPVYNEEASLPNCCAAPKPPAWSWAAPSRSCWSTTAAATAPRNSCRPPPNATAAPWWR